MCYSPAGASGPAPRMQSGQRQANSTINEVENAKSDFEKTIELNPEFAHAYYSRGLCNFDLDEVDAGVRDFETAGKLKFDFSELQTLYKKLGAYQGPVDGTFNTEFRTVVWHLGDRRSFRSKLVRFWWRLRYIFFSGWRYV